MKFNAAGALFVLVGAVLSSQPALSQGAAGWGGGAPTTPQPRMAPIPSPSMGGALQGMPSANGRIGSNSKIGGGGPKQELSKAPLPSGYTHDTNGRIVFDGVDDNGKGGSWGPNDAPIVTSHSNKVPVNHIVSRGHSDGHGGITFGKLPPGNYDIVLTDAQQLASRTPAKFPPGSEKGAPTLIALLLPAVQHARMAGPGGASTSASEIRVEHAVALGALAHISFTVPPDGTPTTVDWGDGSPASAVAREGTPSENKSAGAYGLAMRVAPLR